MGAGRHSSLGTQKQTIIPKVLPQHGPQLRNSLRVFDMYSQNLPLATTTQITTGLKPPLNRGTSAIQTLVNVLHRGLVLTMSKSARKEG